MFIKKEIINSMAEISKEIKIICVINAIIAFIYGFFYLIIPGIYRNMVDATYYDPTMWMDFGATCFVLGIFSLVAIKRAEWERVKMIFEIVILWLILILIVAIWTLVAVPGSATAQANTVFNIILIIAIIIYNSIFYYREQK